VNGQHRVAVKAILATAGAAAVAAVMAKPKSITATRRSCPQGKLRGQKLRVTLKLTVVGRE
jgi:hypothetical protein